MAKKDTAEKVIEWTRLVQIAAAAMAEAAKRCQEAADGIGACQARGMRVGELPSAFVALGESEGALQAASGNLRAIMGEKWDEALRALREVQGVEPGALRQERLPFSGV